MFLIEDLCLDMNFWLDLQNSPFYENRKMLSSAKELAAKKDVEALKELVDTEVHYSLINPR